jgi:choline dehydrogenase
VLPYFKRIEDSPFGPTELRGQGGPLKLGRIERPHPLARAFVASAVACGLPMNDD